MKIKNKGQLCLYKKEIKPLSFVLYPSVSCRFMVFGDGSWKIIITLDMWIMLEKVQQVIKH